MNCWRRFRINTSIYLVVVFIVLSLICIVASRDITNNDTILDLDEGELVPLDTAKQVVDILDIESLPVSFSYVFGNYFDIDNCTYVDTAKSMIVEENGENYIIWVRKEQ